MVTSYDWVQSLCYGVFLETSLCMMFASGTTHLADWEDSLKLFLESLMNCAVVIATVGTHILEFLWWVINKFHGAASVGPFTDHEWLFTSQHLSELSTTHMKAILWNSFQKVWTPSLDSCNLSSLWACQGSHDKTRLLRPAEKTEVQGGGLVHHQWKVLQAAFDEYYRWVLLMSIKLSMSIKLL